MNTVIRIQSSKEGEEFRDQISDCHHTQSDNR